MGARPQMFFPRTAPAARGPSKPNLVQIHPHEASGQMGKI